jgi:hypothetical protein
MKNQQTIAGYPIGKVAKMLRRELYSGMTDHEVEAVSVVLIYHLIIEGKLNKLLYKCTGEVDLKLLNKKLLEEIKWRLIESISFSKKMELIRPLAKKLWPKEYKKIINDFSTINEIRNRIFHRLEIKTIEIKDKLLSSEEGIFAFVDFAHQRSINIDDLLELAELD